MKKNYGKTWWGRKWLDMFEDIDDENRLPRGRTYANKGAASNIKIVGDTVSARVQGSRPTPYKVTINFEQFSKKHKDIIREIIEKSPSILSALINRRLPLKIFDALTQAGINLFPRTWKDVKADCSCPDYAMPCKHIAAVIYLICDEIDKNPSIVFNIHDCNIFDLIGNFEEGKLNAKKPILKIESLFKHTNSQKNIDFDSSIYNIDLSQIPDLESTIFDILKANIVFYEKNLPRKIKLFYNLIKPLGYNKEPSPKDFIKKFGEIESWNTFEISINDQHKIIKINSDSGKDVPQKIFTNLFDFFSSIPISALPYLNKNLRFSHMVFQLTVKLMKSIALIPQILQNSSGETFIRWIPALFNEKIRDIIDEMSRSCPSIVENVVDAKEQINSLVAILVASRVSNLPPYSLQEMREDLISDLFFSAKAHKFSNFSEIETPNAINQWLSNLYLTVKSHKLYLAIEDRGENFSLDVKVILDKQREPLTLEQAFENVSATTKMEILSDISSVAEHLPELENIIDEKKAAIFEEENFTRIFFTILPTLKSIGVFIALPKSLQKIFTPNIALNLKAKQKIKDSRTGFLSLESLLDFDWTIAIGDCNISLEEFKKLLKKSKGLVRFANQYVLIDEKAMESLLKRFESLPRTLSQNELMQAMLAESYESATVNLDEQIQELFSEMKKYKSRKVPSNLNTQLREYQERGFNWLVQNIDVGFGSILADDMGLGKTVQVIATMLHLKNNGILEGEKILVVAPTSLLTNWAREIERFAPDLKFVVYHGSKRELNSEADVVITSYGLVYGDKKQFQKHRWFLIIVDEAQNIKNPLALQTKAIKLLETKHKIALSGTPVENRLLEYWSIFDFTNKNYLGTQSDFNKNFAAPIEKERNKDCLDKFIKITSPFILRRCKSDRNIIKDLPEKLENDKYCSLTKDQAAIYQEILNSSMKQIEESEGINRRGLVLKLINSLKQICNHPAQFGKRAGAASLDESGKSKILEEILSEIYDLGEKTLIFTQYIEMGKILVDTL
ncbi:MAG: DEAD/DEAH box helicase family protein, partial [Holosporaceae bacterium]|nr:DEAD/DEAH box helicase family protein [Holosporaceae bacterium]